MLEKRTLIHCENTKRGYKWMAVAHSVFNEHTNMKQAVTGTAVSVIVNH